MAWGGRGWQGAARKPSDGGVAAGWHAWLVPAAADLEREEMQRVDICVGGLGRLLGGGPLGAAVSFRGSGALGSERRTFADGGGAPSAAPTRSNEN